MNTENPGYIPNWTDEQLGEAIESSANCGDAGGGLALEAWKRYKKKKEQSDRYMKLWINIQDKLMAEHERIRRCYEHLERARKSIFESYKP